MPKIKDLTTDTSTNSDDYFIISGETEGTRKILATDIIGDYADTLLSNITLASALSNLGFAGQSLTENGYYKFPNGLIIQWGYVSTTAASSNQTITFPIAFPNACLHVMTQINYNSSSGFAAAYICVLSKSTTNFVTSYKISRYWLAIGY